MQFNAAEVMEMAVRAEENGGKFYRRAAELHGDAKEVVLLNALAAMEDEHLRIFSEMRDACKALADAEATFDPYLEATLYLDHLADGDAGEGSPRMTEKLNGEESIEDILKMAIQFEQKAILFFSGMRDMVPEALGRDQVQAIIDEEKQHVVTLAQALRDHRSV